MSLDNRNRLITFSFVSKQITALASNLNIVALKLVCYISFHCRVLLIVEKNLA
uniref:Uncharacterized protein n=1 Tax=Tetranychus urticae TaxID=32264 RepID=T1K6P6_TETUR